MAKLTDFSPDSKNANKGTERGLRALDDSISQLGLGRSIVVDMNGVIIAGNKTHERSIDRGIEDAIVVKTRGQQLVVVQREDLDLSDPDPQNPARMLAYADNRVGQLDLDFDAEQLLADVNAGMDLSSLFRDDELDALLAGVRPEAVEDPGAQIDRADELQQKWQCERGQLWIIPSKNGKSCHRILCGDSTVEADVARLMDGKRADAVITDPPYGTTDLSFDKTSVDFIFWDIAKNICHDSSYFAMFAPVEMLAECAKSWSLRFTGCWIKAQGGKRTATAKKPMCQSETYAVFAHPNHRISELVWNKVYFEGTPYRRVQTNTGYQRGGKDQLDRANTSTWSRPGYVSENDGTREYTDTLFASAKNGMGWDERTIHPTQKPIEVIRVIMQWLTNEGMIIYDPFLGSGTTIVAAETTKRVGHGIEIHPPYVAVALERLSDMGLSPRLSEDAT